MIWAYAKKNSPAYLSKRDRESDKKIWFLVWTEKIGEVVLLRVDEAKDLRLLEDLC